MGVYQKTIGPLIAVPIRRLDPLFFFWLAALALLLIPGLDLPIRDWDEGIVARVAYERGQALLQWLSGQASFSELWLPTYWDAPYLNKPPGLHLPASLAFAAMGVCRRRAAGLGRAAGASALRQCCGAAGRIDQPPAEPQTTRERPSPPLPLPSPCFL